MMVSTESVWLLVGELQVIAPAQDRFVRVILWVWRCSQMKTDKELNNSNTTSTNEPETTTSPQFPPTLLVFNAASIAKPHAIESLEAELKSLDIDIAVISETHLKSKHKDGAVSIPGYTLHRKDRTGRRGWGRGRLCEVRLSLAQLQLWKTRRWHIRTSLG